MKDFIDELKYMCSASNTSSRGFYIGIAVFLIIMALCIPASLILLIINLIKGYFSVLFLILFIASLLITIGLIVWLKKS